MKKLAIAGICFGAVSPSPVFADPPAGVNIISKSYSGTARWDYSWYHILNPTGVQSWELYSSGSGTTNGASIDGDPIRVGMPPPINPPGISLPLNGSASVGAFSFHIQTYAGNSQFGYGSDGEYYGTGGGNVYESAQASWLFNPTSENVQMTLNMSTGSWYAQFGSNLSVTLLDITDSNTMASYSFLMPEAKADVFFLNSNNTYQLSVAGSGIAFAGDYQSRDVTASFAVVPEPCELAFLSCGFGVIMAVRKWFRRTD